jgi:diguanylate cyclase (GGDEF)-like protein
MEQIESLERVASSLVEDDVDETLRQVAVRAASAVGASAFVLAVRPLLYGEPWVLTEGAVGDPASTTTLVRWLLDPQASPPVDELAVVDVASPHRFYGRLAAAAPDGRPFGVDERRLLAAYAGLAATALDAAASRETSEILLSLARSLADLGRVEEVCERVVRVVPALVGSPKAAVALWDEERGVTTIPAALGMGAMADVFRSMEVSDADTPEVRKLLDDPGVRLFRDDMDDPFISGMLSVFEMRAVSVVPIVRLGNTLGSIVIGWDPGDADSLDPEVVERLTGLAAQAATAIDNARLLERTTRQAMHDALTGLPNRLLLEDRLTQALARARRESTKVGVLLLDLDSFKVVNDTFGHGVGDLVLWATAERLLGLLRRVDTAARLGGDEFVVVCPDVADATEVADIARRVGEALARPLEVEGASIVTGASVGWTIADGSEGDVRSLLHEADEAMYRVKRRRSGRSQLSPSSEPVVDDRNVRR